MGLPPHWETLAGCWGPDGLAGPASPKCGPIEAEEFSPGAWGTAVDKAASPHEPVLVPQGVKSTKPVRLAAKSPPWRRDPYRGHLKRGAAVQTSRRQCAARCQCASRRQCRRRPPLLPPHSRAVPQRAARRAPSTVGYKAGRVCGRICATGSSFADWWHAHCRVQRPPAVAPALLPWPGPLAGRRTGRRTP